MPGNEFSKQKFVDHQIVDENGAKVGDIRVKPSGVLWSPKGAHKWFGIELDDFAEYMEKNGKPQKK